MNNLVEKDLSLGNMEGNLLRKEIENIQNAII
jgi:hypothetical protein